MHDLSHCCAHANCGSFSTFPNVAERGQVRARERQEVWNDRLPSALQRDDGLRCVRHRPDWDDRPSLDVPSSFVAECPGFGPNEQDICPRPEDGPTRFGFRSERLHKTVAVCSPALHKRSEV